MLFLCFKPPLKNYQLSLNLDGNDYNSRKGILFLGLSKRSLISKQEEITQRLLMKHVNERQAEIEYRLCNTSLPLG